MPNCDRCPGGDEIAGTGLFGYGKLCVSCYCFLIYGPTNNVDPKVERAGGNERLTDYE